MGEVGTGDIDAGAGAAPLRLDPDGSRDAGWSRDGYGELGNVRFLNVRGVVSAGPMLPPRPPPESPVIRGDGRLKAAAEMVRVPGGNGAGVRDGDDLFVGPFPEDRLLSVGKR